MSSLEPRERRRLTVAALGGLALLLRLHDLTGESLVNDEFHTLTALREYALTAPAGIAEARPLFFAVMKAWTAIAGYSEVALRLPSAVFGALAAVAAYAVARELYDHRTGLLAGTVLAVSPFFVWHAQQARMYGLLPLVSLAAVWAFVRVLHDSPGIDRRTAGLYVAAAVLLGYTHLYGLILLAGFSVYVVLAAAIDRTPRFRGGLRRWFGLQAAVGVLLLPSVVAVTRTVLGVVGVLGRGAGAATVSGLTPWNEAPGLYRLFLSVVRPLVLTFDVATVVVLGGSLLVALLGTAIRNEDDGGYVLLLWLAGWTVGLAFAVSHLLTPIFFRRYTIGAAAILVVAVARAVATVRTDELRVAAAVLLVLVVASPLPGYYAESQKQQWRQGAADLERETVADDVVLATPPHVATNVRYYYDGPAAVVPLRPTAGSTAIRNATRGQGRVWLVAFRSVDRTRAKRDLLLALNRSRTPVAGEGAGRTPVGATTGVPAYRTYMGFDVYLFEPANASDTG